MTDSEYLQKLRKFDEKIEGLAAESAISLIDDLVTQESSLQIVFQMHMRKAMLLSSRGMVREAIDLFEDCSNRDSAEECAAYYAAELLVVEHRYVDALRCLEKAERQMAARGSNYYASCIYLLHAYCAAKLCKFSEAKQFLDRSVAEDSELTLFWVNTRPIVSARTIEGLIAEGKSQ
jgi:tetratricopeptide (TPR) repeat protein